MNTIAKTAKLMTLLAEAETEAAAARKEEARTARAATRAAAQVKAGRARLAEARRELRTAERTGKRIAAATRKATSRETKLAHLVETARAAKADATTARRAARAAARRLDRISLRAAVSASRTVAKISQRLGESSLTPAPETDPILAADQLPSVEEIELHAARYAVADRQAKAAEKVAEAEKKWLRRLPAGTYGRAVITRTPGASILDGTQVALDYADRGLVAPRKSTKQKFKCDATALLGDTADAVETADGLGLTLTA